MHWKEAILHSKVARRIVLLFVWCALVPLTILAVLSFYEVSSHLRDASLKQLVHTSKSEGMVTFNNLELLGMELQLQLSEGADERVESDAGLDTHFRRVTLISERGKARAIRGRAIDAPALSEAEETHLAKGHALLKTLRQRNGEPDSILMLSRSGTAGHHKTVIAELNPEFLFEAKNMPRGVQLCVMAATKTPLTDCEERSHVNLDELVHVSGMYEWKSDGVVHDSAYWKLLLGPTYLQEPWTILVSQRRDEVMAPMIRFRRTFPLIVLLAIWIVLLFSLIQIRRTLGPLERLQAATQKVGEGNFDLRVDVRSGDEFESLGASFNAMAQQLGEQFRLQEEMQLGTLTALARAIDAKSDWTLGHSERVTVLAVEIARGMGLPEKELKAMRMGGLLHDIGKIGTPAGILDKPGKLSTEEMQVMRNHVEIGVRILEPITGFREILPIVLQHHEWYNGGGYPGHLKGEEIHLHARIFAVADCYDALISDRPYRKGLPKEESLEILRDLAGQQFDPKVLEVLFRIMEERAKAEGVRDVALAGSPS